MDTLSNVDICRGEKEPLTLDLSPSSSRVEQDTQAWVSSNYVRKENHNWFVLRVTYNRVEIAYEILIGDHIQAYMPMHNTYRQNENNKIKRKTEPLLPNILFVYATVKQIDFYIKHHPILSHFLRYFRDKTKPRMPDDKHPPLIVRFNDMMNFIRTTSIDNEHIKVVEPKQCHYKGGDIVLITDGDFKGVKGKVARVSGKQRVVVEIEGLCLVATAYIPTAFISKTY